MSDCEFDVVHVVYNNHFACILVPNNYTCKNRSDINWLLSFLHVSTVDSHPQGEKLS